MLIAAAAAAAVAFVGAAPALERWSAAGTSSMVRRAGNVEEWALFNNTGDSHPIHLHLVQFKIMGRQVMNKDASLGGLQPPAVFEAGWKDVVATHPGMVTRLRAKFSAAPAVPRNTIVQATNSNWNGETNRYMYHCHILEHEDNDMMRPFTVG